MGLSEELGGRRGAHYAAAGCAEPGHDPEMERHRRRRACRKLLALTAGRAWRSTLPSVVGGRPMILSAIAEKLKRRSKYDFKGRHFEAPLILQAVSWYLRYSLSYRDIEELFRERGLAVDHATVNRWVLTYAPLIERRLRSFRKPHCGSIRIDETHIKIRGQWRYLYRAIDKHGTPVDFLLTAKRFFRKMLKDQPLLAPDRIGTDGTGPYPPAIAAARKEGLLPQDPLHYVTKHLQQGIESDHFRVKRPMPRIGGFQSFRTARRFPPAWAALPRSDGMYQGIVLWIREWKITADIEAGWKADFEAGKVPYGLSLLDSRNRLAAIERAFDDPGQRKAALSVALRGRGLALGARPFRRAWRRMAPPRVHGAALGAGTGFRVSQDQHPRLVGPALQRAEVLPE